jgi:hypothetical protein
MPKSGGDLTIQELLDDPLTKAVMQADRVDALALRRMLGTIAMEVQSPARQADYQPLWQNFPPAQVGIGQWVRSQLCGAC